MWFLLPDSPTTAWWLVSCPRSLWNAKMEADLELLHQTDREKVIAVMRTTDNRTGMENKVFKMSQ